MKGIATLLWISVLLNFATGQDQSLPNDKLDPMPKKAFWEELIEQERLTGDWWGARSHLEENGVTFEVFYTGEMFSNVSGGIRRKTEYLDNIDIIASLDAEKLLGWPGATGYFYFLGNNGGNPSRHIGDVQVASNIEANSTWKVYEAWIEQSFLAHRVCIKVGLYDLNSEFDVTETASLFLNSSHGIGFDFSQSGKNAPSIFPTTATAARIYVEPGLNAYFQAAVLDGVPGDLGNPKRTQIVWKKEDGVLIAAEAGVIYGGEEECADYFGKYAIGGWYYTGKFEDVLETDELGDPVLRRGNSGFYAIAEQEVYHESKTERLCVFGRIGFAAGDVNQAYFYTGAGLVYTGLIPGRDQDQIGFAVAAVYSGSDFRRARRYAGSPVEAAEVNLEFTYLALLTPWLTAQPDLQYIINPGMDPELKNALAVGLRFTVSF